MLRAVLRGVGVDEHRRRAALLGGQRLEPAIAVRDGVADEDDLAPHVDALRLEPVVVVGIPAGRVYDRRLDLARLRVGVVVQQRLLRVRIAAHRIFREPRLPAPHRQLHLGWEGQQHLVLDDLDGVEPVLLPLVAHPLGEVLVAIRSGDVRLVCEVAVVVARAIGRGQRQEPPLELTLRRLRAER